MHPLSSAIADQPVDAAEHNDGMTPSPSCWPCRPTMPPGPTACRMPFAKPPPPMPYRPSSISTLRSSPTSNHPADTGAIEGATGTTENLHPALKTGLAIRRRSPGHRLGPGGDPPWLLRAVHLGDADRRLGLMAHRQCRRNRRAMTGLAPTLLQPVEDEDQRHRLIYGCCLVRGLHGEATRTADRLAKFRQRRRD